MERYREKITLLNSLELDLNEVSDDSLFTIVFFYLLGACQIKFSLIMPTISKLLDSLAMKKPKIFIQVWSQYFNYLSDKERSSERYNIKLAPPPDIPDDKSLDSTLEKLPSIRARVAAIVADKEIRFGEMFALKVKSLDYSIISPNGFGNVLKVLVTSPFACGLIDFTRIIDVKHLEEGLFKSSIQKNLLPLLGCYSRSCKVDKSLIMDEFLPMGDNDIQSICLDAIFSAGSGESNWMLPSFKLLLDEKRYRDELVSLCEKRELFLSDHFSMDILMRLIFGRLIAKRLAKNKSAMQVRRKAFLGFIAIWPIDWIIKFIQFIKPSCQGHDDTWIGYLSLLQFVIQQLPVIPVVFDSIFESIIIVSTNKRLRGLVLKRALQLMKKANYIPANASVLLTSFYSHLSGTGA